MPASQLLSKPNRRKKMTSMKIPPMTSKREIPRKPKKKKEPLLQRKMNYPYDQGEEIMNQDVVQGQQQQRHQVPHGSFHQQLPPDLQGGVHSSHVFYTHSSASSAGVDHVDRHEAASTSTSSASSSLHTSFMPTLTELLPIRSQQEQRQERERIFRQQHLHQQPSNQSNTYSTDQYHRQLQQNQDQGMITSSADYTSMMSPSSSSATTTGARVTPMEGQETSAESMYLLNLSDQTALASGNIVTSSAEALASAPTSIDSIGQQMMGAMNVSNEPDQQHQDQRHLLHLRRHEETKQSSSRSSHQPEDQKKANHSEIEKRRREKMNSCIKELASMIPICSGMSRKLDKLTVLRMAVQHLKTIRGNMNSFVPDSSQSRPSFLSDKKMYDLILKVAEGFLFVVSCDRGKILFITESVNQVLNYERGDLLGQNLFDILHPKDVAKVKEQLTSSDLLTKKERYVDAKTMLPVSSAEVRAGISDHHHGGNRGSKTGASSSTSTNTAPGLSAFSPGARRSFFCRMKCKPSPQMKQEEADTTTPATKTSKKRKNSLDKKYVVIHCLGYIKSWSSSVTSSSATSATSSRGATRTSEDDDADGDACGSFNLSCLVAVGKTIPPFTSPTSSTTEASSSSTSHPTAASASGQSSSSKKVPTDDIQFVTRHAMDGKFVFVDQRAVFILGFLPQELLGTSNYEYCHPEDVKNLADSHRLALASKTDITSKPYRFKTKANSYVYIQTKWTNFKNPWTKEFEFLVARNTCVPRNSTFDSSLVDSSRLDPKGSKSRGDDGSSYLLPRHHHHRRESPSSEDGLMPSTGLSCLDEMIHNLQSSSSPKSGPSSNENSSGSNSESRVKKLLSSSRVNLWKIGKQIAEEALETQRNRYTDTSGDSTSYSAGGPRSNVSSNVSSPSLPGSTASDRGSSSGGATVGGNGDSIAKGSLTSSSTRSTGNERRNGREGGGNGSDSGNSSTYSTNTFYTGSNNMHQMTSQVPSSASSLASQAAANAAAASSSSSNSTSNSSASGFLINCSGSDPLLASSAVSSLGGLEPMSGVREAQVEEEEAASSSSCPEVPSSTATGGNNIDDAAMALVLSLLESDDRIQEGSSVDFNDGLNWPSF